MGFYLTNMWFSNNRAWVKIFECSHKLCDKWWDSFLALGFLVFFLWFLVLWKTTCLLGSAFFIFLILCILTVCSIVLWVVATFGFKILSYFCPSTLFGFVVTSIIDQQFAAFSFCSATFRQSSVAGVLCIDVQLFCWLEGKLFNYFALLN